MWLTAMLDAPVVSIHAPNEGSDEMDNSNIVFKSVSIHAPNEGSDRTVAELMGHNDVFQSTLPMKGATR